MAASKHSRRHPGERRHGHRHEDLHEAPIVYETAVQTSSLLLFLGWLGRVFRSITARVIHLSIAVRTTALMI